MKLNFIKLDYNMFNILFQVKNISNINLIFKIIYL